ncbi:MAG: 50S ribosomal protein L17 [Spiroplasma sp.]|nr:50S ribosomal protein L17 [Mycoplasmatales bacterium]
MYKSKGYRKLGRTSAHRKALLRNQTTDLLVHGEITTTLEKAKEVRKVAEKTITLGKKGDIAARRRAAAYLRPVKTADDQKILKVLFDEIAPKYAERNGGYTRIIKLGTRRGDNAELAKIELV